MPLQVITRHFQTQKITYISRSMPSNSTQTIAPAPAHDLSGNVTDLRDQVARLEAELMYLKDTVKAHTMGRTHVLEGQSQSAHNGQKRRVLSSAETQAADREDRPKYAGKKLADLEMSNPESVTWSKHWRLYVAIGFVAVLVLM